MGNEVEQLQQIEKQNLIMSDVQGDCVTQMQNRNALIVGLGATGLSCAKFLSAKGWNVSVADTRKEPPCKSDLFAFNKILPVYLEKLPEDVLPTIDLLVLSPGISLTMGWVQQARSMQIPVVGDIELFAQYVDAPVLAITGSNGKSTVTSLVGEMCEAAGKRTSVGGNLGRPALDLLNDQSDVYVLELSSFQLETLSSLRPAVSVILNITPDHLDRYADFEHYADTKRNLFRMSQNVVVNLDDKEVNREYDNTYSVGFTKNAPRVGEFGLRKQDDTLYLAAANENILAVSELKLVGEHNYLNCLAALAMGQLFGLTMEAMKQALRSFEGLPHRTELVLEKDNVLWVNDSKATNVGATIAALDGFSKSVILIAGGQAKDQDFSALKGAVQGKVSHLILLGEDAKKIEASVGQGIAIHYVDSMQQAVKCAKELVQKNQVVLLSPACASFDMFANYQERGEVFKQAVVEVCA